MQGRLQASLLVWVLAGIPAAARDPDIIGSWRGTSRCADTEHFPACNDEQVIYDVRAKAGSRDTVTIGADKVVEGVRQFMGEFEFHHAADGSWVADTHASNIVLRLNATHLTGTFTDVPSGRKVRDIALERVR